MRRRRRRAAARRWRAAHLLTYEPYGCRCTHVRLQGRPRTVAAPTSYGCRAVGCAPAACAGMRVVTTHHLLLTIHSYY